MGIWIISKFIWKILDAVKLGIINKKLEVKRENERLSLDGLH
jgi:hypothetical protein